MLSSELDSTQSEDVNILKRLKDKVVLLLVFFKAIRLCVLFIIF